MTRTRVVVTALVLLLTACGPSATPEEQAANQEILDGVAEQLSSGAGVTEVTASYVDDVENDARAAVSVECERCDVPAVYEAALRAVWSSEVTPLLEISIRVNDPVAVQTRIEVLSVPSEEAALTETYGERPVPSIPDEG